MKLLTIFSTFLLSGMVFSAAVPADPSTVSSSAVATATPTPAEDAEMGEPIDDDGGAAVIEGGAPDPVPTPAGNDTFDGNLDRRSLPSKLEWTKSNWKAGKVTGNHLIVFNSNGNVRFKTHFHNSAVLQYKYSLVCYLIDAHMPEWHAFYVSRGRNLGGWLGPSRTHNKDVTKNFPKVKDHWAAIVAGDRIMHCRLRTKWTPAAAIKEIIGLIGKLFPHVKAIYRLLD